VLLLVGSREQCRALGAAAGAQLDVVGVVGFCSGLMFCFRCTGGTMRLLSGNDRYQCLVVDCC
jgi:hypothetical protein